MGIGIVDASLKVSGLKKLKAQAESAGKALGGINAKLEEASGGLKVMGAAGAAAFVGIALAANKAVKAFGVQIEAERSLEVAFKGMGAGAAGAANEIKALAANLQKVTTFGDEATIKAAAFLRIQGMTTDQIKNALPVIQDFAAVTGMELTKAAILAGRAMTGNVSVLERYVGSIDDARAATIDALPPQEKAAAVAALLAEKVGGQARVLRQSGVGAMTAYGNAVGDLWEALGKLIDQPVQAFFEDSIKSVVGMTEAVANLRPWARDLAVTVAKWGAIFAGAAAAIGLVAVALPHLIGGLGLMKVAWLALKPAILAALVPLASFLAAMGVMITIVALVRKTWHDFGSAFVFEVKEMFGVARAIIIGWAQFVGRIFAAVVKRISGALRGLIGSLGQLAFALGLEDLAKQIKSFQNISFEMDFGLVGDAANAAANIAGRAFTGVAVAGADAAGAISGAFTGAFREIGAGFDLLKGDLRNLFVGYPDVAAVGGGAAGGAAGGGRGALGGGGAGGGKLPALVDTGLNAILRASAEAEAAVRKQNVAEFNKQGKGLSAALANIVTSEQRAADAFDRVAAAWERGQQKLGARISAGSQALQGNISGAASALVSGMGPVVGAAVGVAGALFDASAAGKAFKERLSATFGKFASLLNPIIVAISPVLDVLDALVPVVRAAVDVVMFTLQPALGALGAVLEVLSFIISSIMIAFRSAYIGILRFVSLLPGLDFSDEIRQLERVNARAVRERDGLADALGEVARPAAEAAAGLGRLGDQLGTLNVPSGFKIARAAFNADAGRMANDFISRPGLPLQKFSPADTVVGFNGGGPLGGGGGGDTFEIGEVHIHGVDKPEDFWAKVEDAVKFQMGRGGAGLPVSSQYAGV